MEKKKLNRLESLDVLRGFDLFCLVVLEMVLHPLAHAIDMPWFNSFMWGFSHVEGIFYVGSRDALILIHGGSFHAFLFVSL
jgi:hypothetical protein